MLSTTEKIKDRLSIVDVVSQYIDLHKAGGALKAKCPFHNEKSPSFFVSPERGTYYCFGCGAKGDIFSFVQEFEGVDFYNALKILAEKANVEIEKVVNDPNILKKKRVFDCIEEATVFFQNELRNQREALLYLKGRGLSIEMVRDWRIGFARDDWHSLQDYLISKKFSIEEIEQSGLIKKGDSGKFYSRFRGRVMFPIFDSSGRVVAFSGRILNQNTDEAKYINSPETPIFEKSKILYGFDKAKRSMREKDFVILVEGQMDLLLSHQAGFANTVASSGTAFTFEQASLIKRLCSNLYIAYDADNAGQNASFRAWKIALNSGLNVSLISMPKGMDPADAINKDPKIWSEAIEKAKNIIEYYLDIIDGKDKKKDDSVLKEKILPLIASVDSSIDKARFLQKVSSKSGISETSLNDELHKVVLLDTSSDIKEEVFKPASKIKGIKRKSIALLWYLEEKKKEESQKMKEGLKNILDDFDSIYKDDEDKNTLLFEAEVYYGPLEDFNKIIDEILFLLEEDVLKEKFVFAMEALKRAEGANDKDMIEREIQNCQTISNKLSSLKAKYFNN